MSNGSLRPRTVQGFGWVPDLPDARDYMYSAPEAVLTKLPRKVDLRSGLPGVYDQGHAGQLHRERHRGPRSSSSRASRSCKVFTPSRLFIYYNERAMEGTVDSDSGAMIRDGIKSVNAKGAPPESLWPYDIAKFLGQAPAQALPGGQSEHRDLLHGA